MLKEKTVARVAAYAYFAQGFDLRMSSFCILFLHRKEVIQPQVLLRLPCYDFTPIADPTLGRFLPCGLDHVRWVLPTLMV